MRGGNDDAARGQMASHRMAEQIERGGVEAIAWLVQQPDRSIAGDEARQHRAFALASRQHPHRHRRKRPQRHRVDGGVQLRRSGAIELGPEGEGRAERHAAIQRQPLVAKRHAAAPLDPAGDGGEQAGADAQQAGFAHAVGAGQQRAAARFQRQVDAAEQHPAAALASDAVEPQGRAAHGATMSSSTCMSMSDRPK